MDNGCGTVILAIMSDTFDIIIAGGGLNGTSLAIALGDAGFRVALVDPVAVKTRRAKGFDGRGYALSLSSKNVLSAIGIWSEMGEKTQPILGIRVSDGRAGEGASPLSLAFDHAEIEEGPMGYMAEDRYLRTALLKATKADRQITEIDGAMVVDHAEMPGRVTVTLDNGKILNARLLVGCDGKTSPAAKREGISRIGWPYDQTALVCAIEHEKPHDGIAHQFFMPPGPLAILPLPGKKSSIVWTEKRDVANQIGALGDSEYLDALRPRFGTFLGDIKLVGDRFSYPLSLSVASAFVGDRLALVGDAAHAVHPIAGQGLNAGLKDVAALAEVLVEAKRRGEDFGRSDVLERYQRWRRFDVATLALATDGFNRLFSTDNPILRAARDVGLAAVNAMPGVRRSFIREAAGLTGDLPRMTRGLAL